MNKGNLRFIVWILMYGWSGLSFVCFYAFFSNADLLFYGWISFILTCMMYLIGIGGMIISAYLYKEFSISNPRLTR